ncbi:uncharacterized protein LOC142336408 [Convolutriloba macropyga]|uniref:uncharacterized protein LOC142336408 n=1 Tax=Convolutriloba macropyga TaxID=536237 RepID=UPI003F51CD2A
MSGRNNNGQYSRLPSNYRIQREEDSNSDDVSLSRSFDKKALLTLIGFLATAGTTITTTIVGWTQASQLNDEYSQTSNQLSQDSANIDLQIQKQRALIQDEKALWSAFIEDSGILDFSMTVDGYQFSAGRSPNHHTWSDYLEFCRIANATLAAPMNAEQFSAISTVASKKGKCYLGTSKQHDGMNWKTPENSVVSLTRYWGKGQPNELAIDFLCSYVLNDGHDSSIYSASCGGRNPGMTCFICAKRVK